MIRIEELSNDVLYVTCSNGARYTHPRDLPQSIQRRFEILRAADEQISIPGIGHRPFAHVYWVAEDDDPDVIDPSKLHFAQLIVIGRI